MSKRDQATNQNSNRAQNQQRDRWVTNNSNFAGEVYDRFDSLEKSMNTRMDNMEKKMENMESSMNKQMDDIKKSIQTFKTSFSKKAIGILFRDFNENE